jgi:two-component system sensor histidine kinase ResE
VNTAFSRRKIASHSRLDQWSPPRVVLSALFVAFALFLGLDLLEHKYFADLTREQLRAFHFLRGFVATAGGMLVTWFIMRRKETVLITLRNHFEDALMHRTAELNGALVSEEQQRLRLDAILSSMAEALIELNDEGLIKSVNDQFECLLGVKRSQVIGEPAAAFLVRFTGTADQVPLAKAALEWHKHHTGSATYDHPSGQRLVFHWACSPMRINADTVGAVITFVDLTERCRLQEDLLCQREDFLGVINHRLRTPVLANIRANLLLLDGAFGTLSAEQRQLVEAMRENSQDIDRLLNTLMDIYRYKNHHKTLQCEPHAASTLIEESVSHLESKLRERNLVLEMQLPPKEVLVKVDKGEFVKLLSHLADNAVKHARGKICASANVYGECLEIVIEDDGAGIPAEDIPRLFDRFYQISAQGQYSAVTGTGLCLCAEIARAHHGRLSCNSKLGSGTRFTVTLKL